MFVRQLFDSDSSTFTYLIADGQDAALIDPVLSKIDRDLRLVSELGLRLALVLDTHIHADHVTAAGALRGRTGAETCASAAGAPCVDRHLVGGDVVKLGATTIRVLATPGHTDDSVSYAIAGTPGMVFTGDALLVRGCGRTDFQNGDSGQLHDSITHTLFGLGDDTIVFPAHDYNGHTQTTIGEERRHNPRIVGKTRDEFIAIMADLGLPPPKHIHEAVPANRACGMP